MGPGRCNEKAPIFDPVRSRGWVGCTDARWLCSVLAGWCCCQSPSVPPRQAWSWLALRRRQACRGATSNAQRLRRTSRVKKAFHPSSTNSRQNGSACHPPKATALQHDLEPPEGRQDPRWKARRPPPQEADCESRSITYTRTVHRHGQGQGGLLAWTSRQAGRGSEDMEMEVSSV